MREDCKETIPRFSDGSLGRGYMSVLLEIRSRYHQKLCNGVLGYRKGGQVNICDVGSKPSVELSAKLAKSLCGPFMEVEKSGQTVGKEFGDYTRDFLEESFTHLQHVRPGNWLFSTSQGPQGIATYAQYQHIYELQKVLAEHPDLKTALGGDYLITPDIVVARRPLDDLEINLQESFVGEDSAGTRTDLRKKNYPQPRAILHASISCKWTMRSDRAQNTRTEALNLIRNRKGNTPHIMVVTFEPLPSRLASIALGTGDVDCVYHAALYELLEAAAESPFPNQLEILSELVEGKRLRDISDLPLDLAI